MSDKEPKITMTEDLALPAKVALEMMSVSLERRRRILELRAQRDRLQDQIALVHEAIAVEEADLKHEGKTIEGLFEQWQKVVDLKFAEARAAEVTA